MSKYLRQMICNRAERTSKIATHDIFVANEWTTWNREDQHQSCRKGRNQERVLGEIPQILDQEHARTHQSRRECDALPSVELKLHCGAHGWILHQLHTKALTRHGDLSL